MTRPAITKNSYSHVLSSILEFWFEEEDVFNSLNQLELASLLEMFGNNPDEAADIVLENDDTGAQTEKHQRRMMREINKLVANSDQPNGIGYLDPSDYNRSVGVLLASGDAVISKPPKGAWTHKVYEAMTNL